jgi:hypothetical protein
MGIYFVYVIVSGIIKIKKERINVGNPERDVENLKKAVEMEKKNLELYKEYAKDAPVEGCEIMYHDIIVEREKEIERMTKAKEYWEAEIVKK